MNDTQLSLMLMIDNEMGANKGLYIPGQSIYEVAGAGYTRHEVKTALRKLTDNGYLETRERGYRITSKGFIFMEAYFLSLEIKGELRQELNQALDDKKEELENSLRATLGFQWLGIIVAFLIILVVVLLR